MFPLPQQAPIQNLDLLARQVVEGFLIGLHKSPFHGFSVEFAEHRLYNSGDQLKYVDWKIFGRTDKMFVKKFEEETNLRCCLALDTSSSMNFRTEDGYSKLEFASILAASLSYLIQKQMDACSLALFNEHLYHLMPAKSGKKHQRLIISELERVLSRENKKNETRLAHSLHEIAERIHQRSLVVIFSDVPEVPENNSELIAALQHLKFNKHEVLLFHITDSDKEMDLNFENRPYTFEDMETGTTVRLNPEEYKEIYKRKTAEYRKLIQDQCFKHRIDYIYCDMKKDPALALAQYLVKRNKMM